MPDDLKSICREIRREILKVSYEAGACHIGSALSCVEILVSLYWNILKKEDIFLFSKASGASALYCVLAKKGIIPRNKVAYYLKNYPLASKEVPGIIHSVGSLGHGLSVACGLALADRKRRVFCLISDAELNEGSTWEALLFAAHHKLSNLIIIVDRNNLQALGKTEDILKLENLYKKFKAFNCEVYNIDGHSFGWGKFLDNNNDLTIIIANTIKGKGVKQFENKYESHYQNITKEGLAEGLLQLNS